MTQIGIASHLRREVSCDCTIELPPNLKFILSMVPSTIANIATRDLLHLNLVDDRKSSDFYSTKQG
jgi:hypothetical protein